MIGKLQGQLLACAALLQRLLKIASLFGVLVGQYRVERLLKGLRCGLYTGFAPMVCGFQNGSWGYETIDANTFAGWGVDLVKNVRPRPQP